MYNSLVTTINSLDYYQPIMVYFTWITLHYLASHIYVEYCVNWSWYGYIMSPFQVINPLCKGINWFIYESSGTISNMFLVVGSSVMMYLSKYKIKDQ